ncbi:MAG TPA: O-antigen ligase family protein [Solirubrobacteraceae bacterium]|nr:O-antigen ligase family protein [Solirubrobacteraceae bacterium]
MALLGATLLVRVLTDNRSAPDSHHSGSLNLSGAIALLFILIAAGLLLQRRRGIRPTALAALWLCVWTAVAVDTSGASAETVREGVREASVIALAVIVYNARGAVTVSAATRLVQFVGFVPAVLAVYQIATDTGMDISGNIRSNGTFAHPNSAAMFFAIASATSLWLYLDSGRRRLDAALTTLFAAAMLTTFSIDGLAALVAMLVALGALRPGSLQAKGGPWLLAGLVVIAFVATPLGGHRIARASATNLAEANGSSLSWRLHKWKLLLPDWESSPVIGRGLGTTITEAGAPGNQYAGEPPHNEYVRSLVETGIVGLAILLGAIAVLIGRIVRLKSTSDTHRTGPPAEPALALVIVFGCLVNALADNTFLDSPTCYAAALIVIAVLSVPSAERRSHQEPSLSV